VKRYLHSTTVRMCYLCVRRLLSFSTLTNCIDIAILLHYRYAYFYDKLQWKKVNDLASIHVRCCQHSRHIGMLLRGRVLSVTQSHNSPMEAQGGERVYSSYSFTSSVLDGGEWSASRPGRALPPRKDPHGTHCTGGWVGLRAGLDTEARGKIRCLCWDRTWIARSSSP
jgi:hypothetical protein